MTKHEEKKSDYQKVLDVIRYDDKPHGSESNSVAVMMRRKEKSNGEVKATSGDSPEQFEEIEAPAISMWPPVSGTEAQGAVTEDGEWHDGQPEFGEEGGPIEPGTEPPPIEPPPEGGDPPPPDMQSFSTTFKRERKE